MNDARGKRGWKEGRGVREREGERREGGGALFGERGISEESPDPEINGQSNPFTITGRKPTAPAASRRPAGQPARPDPPVDGAGSGGGGPVPTAGRRERSQREVGRLQRVAVGGMLRCAPSPDRSLRAPHGRVGGEEKEGPFQA